MNYDLFSKASSQIQPVIADHIVAQLVGMDHDTLFAGVIGRARYAFKLPYAGGYLARGVIPVLQWWRYDMLVAHEAQGVQGHVALQAHHEKDGYNWHVFSVYVKPKYRKHRLGQHMLEQLVAHAHVSEVDNIIIGRNNEYARKVVETLAGQDIGVYKKEPHKLGVRYSRWNAA